MKKIKLYFISASAALGLILLGYRLAYLTIGSWTGCWSQKFFHTITSWFRLPLVDTLLTHLNYTDGIFYGMAGNTLEEIIYRAPLWLILRYCPHKLNSPTYKILLTATIFNSTLYFAAMHACYVFPFWIALVLTAVLLATKSLIPAILAHIGWGISNFAP